MCIRDREYSIHCFEPSPQAFAELSRGKRANNASVILNPVGLGKEVGEVILYYNEPGSQIASLTKRRLDHLGVDFSQSQTCLLYTSDAADDLLCVDLGGRRIHKKKNTHTTRYTRIDNTNSH